MQGKEVSEQETRDCTAGIDVGKSWLDAHVLPASQSLRVANTGDGIRKLKRWLVRWKVELVAVEATGKWHRAVVRSLRASRIATALADPLRVRLFARARGILAKTDRLDAQVLAMFAAMMSPDMREPAGEALEALQELVNARAGAVDEQVALKNQRGTAAQAFLRRQLDRRIKQLDSHVQALETECLRRIKADPALARRFAILTSVPSFGPVVAITLIACFHELGRLSDKQAAALAGLAPLADESGQRNGARAIWGGRAAVRRILYLAAVSAKACNSDMKTFYRRLITNGKKTKQALVAVARKLLVLANILVAQDRLWSQTAPKTT